MTSRVYEDIRIERGAQELKWGEQNHEPSVWTDILMEEVGECSKAILEKDIYGYRDECVQIAAVAVAMVEAFDRRV